MHQAIHCTRALLRHYHSESHAENNLTIRRASQGYFPKGADLSGVSGAEVQVAYDGLNHRPRKWLGWKCPWEVYHNQPLHLL